MTARDIVGARADFIQLDADCRATLRDMRPLIAQQLPGVLDQFYTQIGKYPDVAKLFSNAQHMRHAKEMQLKHWEVIAAGEFGDTYVQSVNRIGEAHNRLGLEPRWYIGGYSFIREQMLEIIEAPVSARRF